MHDMGIIQDRDIIVVFAGSLWSSFGEIFKFLFHGYFRNFARRSNIWIWMLVTEFNDIRFYHSRRVFEGKTLLFAV